MDGHLPRDPAETQHDRARDDGGADRQGEPDEPRGEGEAQSVECQGGASRSANLATGELPLRPDPAALTIDPGSLTGETNAG